MISRILHIARREWLEQRRQPMMLGIFACLYLLLGGVVLGNLGLYQYIDGNDAVRPVFEENMQTLGFTGLEPIVGGTVGTFSFLIFTQFLGFAGVLAGHAMLHDRQCGTLTFLLLSPVRRLELLVGKMLGSIGLTLVMFWVFSGGGAAMAALFPITEPFSVYLPPSPAFLVALFLGGPAWGLFIGAVCTVISAVSRDVRTAQQGVWFVLFFVTIFAGLLLSWLLPEGALVQLGVALLGILGTAGALAIGTAVIRRDVSR